jgi:hypothetical protein
MAKLNETMVVIKVSELLRDDETAEEILDHDTIINLEAVIKELAGGDKLVEIIQENG